jgi:sugar/nucleoside kinase (ribokinase family)
VIGDDPFGARLRRVLDDNGVNTDHLQVSAKDETSVAYAWRDDRGDGHFRLVRRADCRLSPAQTRTAVAALHPVAVVVGSVSTATANSKLAVMAAIGTAQEVPVAVDLNIRISQWKTVDRLRRVLPGLLRGASLVKLSIDDAVAAWDLDDPQAIRQHVSKWFRGPMVITDGSRGVHVFQRDADNSEPFPVFAVNAVEPTGAGDAFFAALLSRMIASGWEVLKAEDIRFAMAAGAVTTTHHGALAALPSRESVERFLVDATLSS